MKNKAQGARLRAQETRIETDVLVPDELGWENSAKIHIEIEVIEGGIEVLCYEEGGPPQTVRVYPENGLTITHSFKTTKKGAAFPVRITYTGEAYHLNKTKNGKLILTK